MAMTMEEFRAAIFNLRYIGTRQLYDADISGSDHAAFMNSPIEAFILCMDPIMQRAIWGIINPANYSIGTAWSAALAKEKAAADARWGAAVKEQAQTHMQTARLLQIKHIVIEALAAQEAK